MQPPLGVLRLIKGSFVLFFASFGLLFPIAFAPTLAGAVLTFVASPPAVGAELGAPGLGGVLVLLALLLVGFVIGGMLCLAALDAALGKRHGVGEYLSQAMRHVGPLIGLGLVLGAATALGALLLVLPGLYLIARFLPYVPAIVFENAGWSGLGRAQALTEDYRWPILGAVLLLGLAVVAVALAPAVLAAAAGLPVIVAILVETIVQAAIYAISVTFTALVYLRLREIKEGATPAEIADSIG